ncbi:MAG: Flp pilus assembly protein CpaB [Candidatus Saccharibacteria bacterium]|nr:Flp pilus assembly protein CpaB [Microbacteriaceae bacterium]
MKVRLLSALAALILALTGGILIASYVQGADERALAGTESRQVLIVATPVPAGTPVADLPAFLILRSIPATAVADGALDTLADASDSITAVALVVGEQLLRSRLVDPSTILSPGTVQVPDGLQQVTVQLGPDRTVGASISAGDTVGVFVSFGDSDAAPAATRLLFQKVLVTNVQGAPAPADASADAATTTTAAPTGSLLVTFALTAADAEKVVFSTQFGTIWLSSQSAATDTTVPGGAMQGNVFP